MSTTPTTRGPYAKTAAVRQRILEAAMEVFAESGYRATTMKEISERAEISQRGLVHHFASKDELLTAVLARHDQEVALRVPNSTGLDALTGLLDVLVTSSTRPGVIELYSILATEALAPDHPGHEHYKNRFSGFRIYLEEAFRTLQNEGRIAKHYEPHTLAVAFASLLEGLQIQWLYDRESVDTIKALRLFLDAVITDFPAATE